ncbi:hypothetical protein [Flavilitoribacter nigricans]|uniref:Intimal thickness related receptor IRP domain-containing protein n=1 Tax=Flavilitoribacter nigricans (strain ATCC 23147 / DSM 23189 / NBRC 102662 / NCIMB 1420 / SS-2) TaxID=1122177 RepID=A0A2D0MWW1_FLAN2|nr:hypothetical protein [Flavilitoribacter nigricans]PHN00725.1 hypothetical protein CRP01_40795 [Flavilitoribacter nigricans DSM 23189 = NBRC 102662]
MLRKFLIVSLLLIITISSTFAQCEIKKVWKIDSLSDHLANYWSEVDEVDINNEKMLFIRSDDGGCEILGCPDWAIKNNILSIEYGVDDTLKAELEFQGCDIVHFYNIGSNKNEKLFVLFANTSTRCDFPIDVAACNVAFGNPNTPSQSEPGQAALECPNLALVFLIGYLLLLITWIVLRFTKSTNISNKAWIAICLWCAFFLFIDDERCIGYLCLLLFVLHLSITVVFLLSKFKVINSVGKLFFYGIYSGLIVLFEYVYRYGSSNLDNLMYFTAVPVLVFLIGGGLFFQLIRDAYTLGFGKLSTNLFAAAVVYWVPYVFIISNRRDVVDFFLSMLALS